MEIKIFGILTRILINIISLCIISLIAEDLIYDTINSWETLNMFITGKIMLSVVLIILIFILYSINFGMFKKAFDEI